MDFSELESVVMKAVLGEFPCWEHIEWVTAHVAGGGGGWMRGVMNQEMPLTSSDWRTLFPKPDTYQLHVKCFILSKTK